LESPPKLTTAISLSTIVTTQNIALN